MDFFEPRDCPMDNDIVYYNSVFKTNVNENSALYNFYKGLNIFVTGASGFMGKVFIEKILRCYPEVGEIYVLMRPKKDKTEEERLSELFNDQLYDRLRLEQVGIERKVHLISGDLNQPMLGLSDADQHFIQNNIDIIVHAAASLRFDELIRDAFTLNVKATKDMLEIASKCKQLKVMLHVSTLYTHSYRHEIDEMFYPNQISHEDLATLINVLSEEEVEILTPMLFGKLYNNTYAFTKAIGESLVEKYIGRIPIAMVRPSIVISTWKDPLICWSNNLYGPGGVCAGAALGVLHTFYAIYEKKCDLIPVDIANNMILAVIWKTAKDYAELKSSSSNTAMTASPPIYNLSISNQFPLTWKQFMMINRDAGYSEARHIASTLAIWNYAFNLEQSKILYQIRVWLLHVLPGVIIDTILTIMNKPPQLIKIYIKIMKFSKYFVPYVERDWIFHTSNVQSLLEQIPQEDLQNLDFSMDSFSWKDCFLYYFRGGKLYILKESYEHNEKGRKHYYRLQRLHYAFLSVCYALFAFILYKIFRSFLYYINT